MILRLVLLAVAVAAVGCGNGEPAAPEFRTDCPEPAERAERLDVDLRTPDDLRMQGEVSWHLVVSNRGSEPVTLVFNSGQLGDVVLSQRGEEIYRWSLARTFTQAIQCFTLDVNDEATLALQNDTLEINAGEYDLVATIAARPTPPTVRRTVEVAPSRQS